jgi:hypothetical protein
LGAAPHADVMACASGANKRREKDPIMIDMRTLMITPTSATQVGMHVSIKYLEYQ